MNRNVRVVWQLALVALARACAIWFGIGSEVATMLLVNEPDGNVRRRAREAAKEIRRFVEQGIAIARWKPGDRLPTERELAERFSIGRNTVRRTLMSLEREGTIVRHVGRGTFISAITR